MASKIRCKACRQYFPKDQAYRRGLSSVCSESCFLEALTKSNKKRIRAERKRAKKKNPARRSLNANTRSYVLERDGKVCRFCGTSRGLHVHHIIYKSQGGSDDPDNLITLCNVCHATAHSSKRIYQNPLLIYIWLEADGQKFTIPEIMAMLATS